MDGAVTDLLPSARELDALDVVLEAQAQRDEVDGDRLPLPAVRRGVGGVLGGEAVDVRVPQRCPGLLPYACQQPGAETM